MSKTRRYRQCTPEQKTEVFPVGLRGDRSAQDACREHEVAETLDHQWWDRLLHGKIALANPKTTEHTEITGLRREVGRLERALGKTYEEVAGEVPREWTCVPG